MDRRPGDPRELLRIWIEWEDGEATPGKMISDLKKKGMRELLDFLSEQAESAQAADPPASDPSTTEA